MGLLGTPEDEGTIIDWDNYKWCNKCRERIHVSCFETDKNGTYKNDCKKHLIKI